MLEQWATAGAMPSMQRAHMDLCQPDGMGVQFIWQVDESLRAGPPSSGPMQDHTGGGSFTSELRGKGCSWQPWTGCRPNHDRCTAGPWVVGPKPQGCLGRDEVPLSRVPSLSPATVS